MHLDRQLKQIIQTLALRLRLRHVFAPNVDAVPPHKHGASLWPFFDCLSQRISKVFFVSSILNDRYLQSIIVAQVSNFATAFSNLIAA